MALQLLEEDEADTGQAAAHEIHQGGQLVRQVMPRPFEDGIHRGGRLLQEAGDHGVKQLLLAGEVPVEGLLADPQVGGQPVHGYPAEALRQETGGGAGDYALRGFCSAGLHGNQENFFSIISFLYCTR